MFLSSVNKSWTLETLDWPEFARQKRKILPFAGQLPQMTLTTPEGQEITTTQSKNILKVLRDVYQPQEFVARVRTDEYVDAADDLSGVTRLCNFAEMYAKDDAVPKQMKAFSHYLRYLNKTSLASTPFLSSENPSIADFAWWHIVDMHRTISPDDVLSKAPNVVDWLERVAKIDGVDSYLNDRAPLSELGEARLPKK